MHFLSPSFLCRFPFCFDCNDWDAWPFSEVGNSKSSSRGRHFLFPLCRAGNNFPPQEFFSCGISRSGSSSSSSWLTFSHLEYKKVGNGGFFYEDVEERDGMNEEMKGGREGKEWKMLFLWDTDRCVTFSKRPDLPQEGKNRNEFPHLEVHKNCFPKQCSP